MTPHNKDNMQEDKTHLPEDIFGAKKIFDYLEVKGKYYEFSSRDGATVLISVTKKKVFEQIKLAKKLAKALKSNLDAEKVLTEVFMTKYDMKNLEKLDKLVFNKNKKYKAKTRDGHCVDMKIGNHIIPLID